MLAILAAISLMHQGQATNASEIFPKPKAVGLEALSNEKIFRYKFDSVYKGFTLGPDWSTSSVPALKADAVKLRVLIFVADRDFSNPLKANTVEMRDKQRLIASMSRLKAIFQVMSDGEVDLEVIPKIVPEPFYSQEEITAFVSSEFNQYKFDADDSEERGPFAASVLLSGSPDVDGNIVSSLHRIGGAKPTLDLEENLMNLLKRSIREALVRRIPGSESVPLSQELILPAFPGKFRALLDYKNAGNAELVSGWSSTPLKAKQTNATPEMTSPILPPAELAIVNDELQYTELSITRAGGFSLPTANSAVTNDTLSFEVKTLTSNPIAIRFHGAKGESAEVVLSNGPDVKPKDSVRLVGISPIKSDGTWQTVKVAIPNGFNRDKITIEPPSDLLGVTRWRDELVSFSFRNFDFTTGAGSVLFQPSNSQLSTEADFSSALSSQNVYTRRQAVIEMSSANAPKFPSLRPLLAALSRDIDAITCRNAVLAYGKLGVDPANPEHVAFIKNLLSIAPTEASREAALLVCADNPMIATFESIAPNSVRRNWRTRLAAVKALAALDRTDIKAKPAARQLLLSCAGQDMATIRMAALSVLSPETEVERKKLEFSLVNDPSEAARLVCLKKLSSVKDSAALINGAFADESPYVRSSIPAVIGESSSVYRQSLQKLVIDADFMVRATTLKLFAKLKDAKIQEFENILQDDHPLVQFTLLKSGLSAGWKIPTTVLDRLSKSPVKSVRDLAEKFPR